MSRAQRRQKERMKSKRRSGGLVSSRAWRIMALVMAVVLVLGAVGWGIFSYVSGARAGEIVLRVVNGQEITELDLMRRESVLKYLYGLTEVDPAFEEALLESLVDEALVEAEAQRRGLTVSDEDLAQLEERIQSGLTALYKTPLVITAQRLRLGVRRADLEDYKRSLLLETELYKAVTAGVSVTEEDIRSLYEENREMFEGAGLSLEDVKDTLAEDALREKREEVYAAFLEELRAQAEISSPE